MKEHQSRTVTLSGQTLDGETRRAVADLADGVIVFPTDTFYGLGTRPSSAEGVRRIYRLKGRPAAAPLLLLIDDPHRMDRLASSVTERHRRLMERFWPGPLTILFTARPGLPAAVVSERGDVAARLPGSALCRRIVAAAGGILTGTSANVSGEAPSRSVSGISASVVAGADLVLDAGTLPPSEVSTVLSLAGGRMTPVREGAVKIGEVEGFLRTEGGDEAPENG